MLLVLSYSLVAISMISLFAKIYYHNKFLSGTNVLSPDIFVRRYYSFKYLFPISKFSQDENKILLAKKANRALKIFYFSFLVLMILSFIGFKIRSGAW
jgi:hypothetical protein